MGRAKKSGKKPFTPGRLNRIVDVLLHPFFEEKEWMILVDGLAHSLIENACTETSFYRCGRNTVVVFLWRSGNSLD